MDPHWAGQHLEVIRTLMERAAVYRRSLGPTALAAGVLGLGAAALGVGFDLGTPRAFGIFWMAVAVLGMTGAVVLMRRQALKDREAFWSPPARRVVQALAPPLFAGLVAGLVAVYPPWREPLAVWWLPPIWMVLYGCALQAAGFFMPRGIRLFGMVFLILGCAGLVLINERSYASGMPALVQAHWLMGATFGGLHLLYGIYLTVTPNSDRAT
jgi:hypothetical protein